MVRLRCIIDFETEWLTHPLPRGGTDLLQPWPLTLNAGVFVCKGMRRRQKPAGLHYRRPQIRTTVESHLPPSLSGSYPSASVGRSRGMTAFQRSRSRSPNAHDLFPVSATGPTRRLVRSITVAAVARAILQAASNQLRPATARYSPA